MALSEVIHILNCTTDAIHAIDCECTTLCDGIEHGLVNIKLQFGERALKEVGKKLTEETLIAWLAREKLAESGWSADWEFPYPEQRRKKCDLVFPLNGGGRLWLELKLACCCLIAAWEAPPSPSVWWHDAAL